MKKIYREAFASPTVHRMLHLLVRAYTATLNIRFENERPWLGLVEDGRRVLLCVWHQQFFSMICPFSRYAAHHPALMISRSRDGELIAGVARHSGWKTVRGSSSEGGKAALKLMIRHMRRHRLGGHVVDGPLGPVGRVKAGAIYLAVAAGAVIVPVTAAPDRAWTFNSWDRFFVPKPFSRVGIRFGPVMELPRPRTEAEFEALRLRLEAEMRKGLRLPSGSLLF
jgi:hypothetical protein